MGNQIISNHTSCLLGNLFRSLKDMYTTLESTSEMTLASATSLYLSLDNEATLVAKGRCNLGSLFRGLCQFTLLYIDSISAHQLFGMEFVKIKESSWLLAEHIC